MCSIHGHYTPDGTDVVSDLAQLVEQGANRGRDGWGAATNHQQWRRPNEDGEDGAATLAAELEPAAWSVANCRAEPTTEWVLNKTEGDVHPFTAGNTVVVHNGTIANDAALATKYNMPVTSQIDSAVLPHLLDRFDFETQLEQVVDCLRDEVVGSFAIAAVQTLPGRAPVVLLATNYKPLHLRSRRSKGTPWWEWTSLPEPVPHYYLKPWVAVSPYSVVLLTPGGLRHETLRRPAQRPTRSLVVCSGGVDSVTCAQLCIDRGDDVTLLHFMYGCRSERNEVAAVTALAAHWGVPLKFIDVTTVFNTIGGSPLTNTNSHIADGESGAEFAHEWVPARNTILLAIALGVAEGGGHTNLVLGNNLEEAGAYPDNEQQFIRLFGDLIPYAVADGVNITIEEPVGAFMKHEIVATAHAHDTPLHLCWSCYNPGDVHCGDCGPCHMRRIAHTINNLNDSVSYAA